jgi:hypothetical protein
MSEPPDEDHEDAPLSERFLDLFVFLPTGLAVTLAEELPRLAERGRERLGVKVNSARAVGQFAVRAGGRELRRRSAGRTRPPGSAVNPPDPDPTATPRRAARPTGATSTPSSPPRLRSIPRPPAPTPAAVRTAAASTATPTSTSTAPAPVRPAPSRPAARHVPAVASLAIPGFDTLSASQVVQRLDGLSRSELVAVRTYETSNRGRRTILSRVDQLLDERS